MALRRMSDALTHRGPDGEGFWEASPDVRGWGAMFAHRRLSILDLSSAGAQPMVDPATGHVIVFNGEIYNYVDLRGRLQAESQTFQSSGDTAVMLRALSVHGRHAVSCTWRCRHGVVREEGLQVNCQCRDLRIHINGQMK